MGTTQHSQRNTQSNIMLPCTGGNNFSTETNPTNPISPGCPVLCRDNVFQTETIFPSRLESEKFLHSAQMNEQFPEIFIHTTHRHIDPSEPRAALILQSRPDLFCHEDDQNHAVNNMHCERDGENMVFDDKIAEYRRRLQQVKARISAVRKRRSLGMQVLSQSNSCEDWGAELPSYQNPDGTQNEKKLYHACDATQRGRAPGIGVLIHDEYSDMRHVLPEAQRQTVFPYSTTLDCRKSLWSGEALGIVLTTDSEGDMRDHRDRGAPQQEVTRGGDYSSSHETAETACTTSFDHSAESSPVWAQRLFSYSCRKKEGDGPCEAQRRSSQSSRASKASSRLLRLALEHEDDTTSLFARDFSWKLPISRPMSCVEFGKGENPSALSLWGLVNPEIGRKKENTWSDHDGLVEEFELTADNMEHSMEMVFFESSVPVSTTTSG